MGEQTAKDQYKDILSRIESNLQEVEEGRNNHRKIDEASGESGDDKFSRRDMEIEESQDYSRPQTRQTDTEKPMRRTQTSAYYRSIEKKRTRYTPSAAELEDDNDIKGSSDDENDVVNESNQITIDPLGNTNESNRNNQPRKEEPAMEMS